MIQIRFSIELFVSYFFSKLPYSENAHFNKFHDSFKTYHILFKITLQFFNAELQCFVSQIRKPLWLYGSVLELLRRTKEISFNKLKL